MGPPEIKGFQHDPRMTPERKKEKEEKKKVMSEFIEKRSGPVGDWCLCENCVATGIIEQNVCCHDDKYVQNWLDKDITCITKHEGFAATVLNIHVLNALRSNLVNIPGIKNNPNKLAKLKSGKPDNYRHLAYVNFRSWICDGTKLGAGNRVVTPACVLNVVRVKWPEPSGVYTGHISKKNNIEDL